MLFSENQPLSTFCNAQEGSECSWIPKSLPDKHFDQSEEVRWGLNRQFVHLRQQRKWGGKCSLARSQLYKRGCHKPYWKHYRTNNYFEWLMCWVECFCNKLVFFSSILCVFTFLPSINLSIFAIFYHHPHSEHIFPKFIQACLMQAPCYGDWPNRVGI